MFLGREGQVLKSSFVFTLFATSLWDNISWNLVWIYYPKPTFIPQTQCDPGAGVSGL